MSGTDYVLTPNLGLYKPLSDADIDAWGAHLNSNADMLDSALHGGPFLPLAGNATVTGPTTLNGGLTLGYVPAGASLYAGIASMNYTSSGTQPNLLSLSANPAGVLPAGGGGSVFFFNIPNDTVDASGTAGFNGMQINWQGGYALKGGHTAVNIEAKVAGPVTNIGAGGIIVGLNAQLAGAAPITAGSGNMIAFSPQMNIYSGATGYGLIEAIEASVGSVTALNGGRFGMTMFSLGSVQGNPSQGDAGITVVCGGVGLTQFTVAYGIGRHDAPWGVLSAGTIMGPLIQTNTTGYIPQQAAFGVNLGSVNFGTSGFAYVSPGFQVDANGSVRSGDLLISTTGATIALDAVGYTGASATLSNAGAAYAANDQLYDTVCNGILGVDTVSGGNISTFHWIRAPHYFGSTPPATLALIGGSGNQLAVANVTWTQGNTLSLNPTGKQVLTNLSAAATDAAAATAGVPINGLYNNAGVVHVRLT